MLYLIFQDENEEELTTLEILPEDVASAHDLEELMAKIEALIVEFV